LPPPQHQVVPGNGAVGQQEAPVRPLAAGLGGRALLGGELEHGTVVNRRPAAAGTRPAPGGEVRPGLRARGKAGRPRPAPRRGARWGRSRVDWLRLSTQSRPSQARSWRIASAYSSRLRAASVSSRRSTKPPPLVRANSQFTTAWRALPTCRRPVGDGAKRT